MLYCCRESAPNRAEAAAMAASSDSQGAPGGEVIVFPALEFFVSPVPPATTGEEKSRQRWTPITLTTRLSSSRNEIFQPASNRDPHSGHIRITR